MQTLRELMQVAAAGETVAELRSADEDDGSSADSEEQSAKRRKGRKGGAVAASFSQKGAAKGASASASGSSKRHRSSIPRFLRAMRRCISAVGRREAAQRRRR